MKRGGAIELLKALNMMLRNSDGEPISDACEAIDMAIEALSDRPIGEWIDYTDDGYVECPFCHNATNCDDNKEELHFCFSCGAYMRGDTE